ncbi:MAG TPA: DUF433 domain-containing protein [Blastocatellia bacterium]|nr:DUF433 domain-containing protein [Blastocatellia bacterium]
MSTKKREKAKKVSPPIDPLELIELDSRGVAWIKGRQVKVIEIVFDLLAHGGGIKEIRSRFAKLTAKEVGAALDYFRDHQPEFQAEIQRRWEQISRLGLREADSPFQKRLRELNKSRKV